MLKIVGTHCYLGGFLVGLQNIGLDVVATGETWKPGAEGATALGLPVHSLDEILSDPPSVDIVVGNPPCSRFSNLSVSFFKEKEGAHEDPGTFPEIVELRDVCLSTGARVLWWETGPLSWSMGRELIREFHDALDAFWETTTTLIAKLDLRYIGIPQRRPRVHVVHMATDKEPPSVPSSCWPLHQSIGEWMEQQVGGHKLNNPVITLKKGETVNSALAWAREQDRTQTFRSMVPKIVSYRDRYALAVISRRPMIWLEEDRWWDLLEYAALMTYPLDGIRRVLEVKERPDKAEVLLSKSVAPAASEWVARNIVLPWLINEEQLDRRNAFIQDMVPPVEWGTNLWALDLNVTDSKRKVRPDDQPQLPMWGE